MRLLPPRETDFDSLLLLGAHPSIARWGFTRPDVAASDFQGHSISNRPSEVHWASCRFDSLSIFYTYRVAGFPLLLVDRYR